MEQEEIDSKIKTAHLIDYETILYIVMNILLCPIKRSLSVYISKTYSTPIRLSSGMAYPIGRR